MAEWADAADLKSAGGFPVPVRVRPPALRSFERVVGIEFKNKALLEAVLTHPSCGENRFYEKMEFLGDSVHELFLREYVIRKFKEGRKKLSLIRDFYSSKRFMAKIIEKSGLFKFLKTSSEKLKKNESVLASFYEALIGYIFYDGGIRKAKEFFKRFVASAISENVSYNPKSLVLMNFSERVKFEIISKEGKPHEPVFEVGLYVDNELKTKGKGKSIKEAEEDASRKFLISFNTSSKHS